MYKLIAMDLDGTLLNSYGEVSVDDKMAIKDAIDSGIEVVLASGRVTESVKNLSKELGINKYLISGNGTIVYDMQKEEVVYNRFIDKNKVLKIIKLCEKNSIYYNIYTDETIIAKSLNYNVLFYNHENSKKADDKKTKITIIQDIPKYIKENKDINIIKITICDNDKIIFQRILKKIRETVLGLNILEIEHMASKIIEIGTNKISIEYYFTEISKANVDKWEALCYIIEQENISPKEVATIGDNINDKKMIENAGLGIVMEQSALQAMNIGDFVTKSNNDSGVSYAIRKLILQ